MAKEINKDLKYYLDTYRVILDLFPEYIFIKDSEGTYLLANEKWSSLVGLPENGYFGKKDSDIFPEDLALSYKKSDSYVLAKKHTYESTAEQILGDGNRISIHFSKTPLLARDGSVCGIFGVFTDISLEQYEKMRHLRLKDASLETSIDGIAFFDTQGYLINKNPSLLNYYPGRELKENETSLEEMWEILFNSPSFEILEHFLASKEKLFVLPEIYSSLEGKYLSLFLSKVIGETGKWIGLMLSLRDITELKEAEERYRNLVEDANSIILKLNAQGQIVFMNRYALSLFGYTQEELIGKHYLGRITDDEELLKKIFQDPFKYKNNENLNITKSGKKIYVAWTNRVYYDSEGNPKEILCIGQDITEKKETEKTLAHAQKMEALGTLINGLTHDFNNLLGGINGYLSGIKLQNELYKDETIENAISKIQDIIISSSEIIRSILPLGKKTDKVKQPVNLNTLIEDILEIIKLSSKKNILFIKNLDPTVPAMEIYKGEMQQVILNILLNAVDALEGSGTITVSTRREDSKKTVFIKLADTGTGMPEDVLNHIFEPYFTTKENKKGTGLGLTMVYSIVKEHGGNIEVESIQNRGTVFTISLPEN